MIGLYTTIDIKATPAQVWEVITDFSTYPQWSGFRGEIKGQAKKGTLIRIIARPHPGKIKISLFHITKVVDERELCWRAHYAWPYLLYGDRFWVLEQIDGGCSCRLTQGEIFKGPLSFIVKLKTQKHGDRSYRELCDRLKQYIEQRILY